MSDDFDFSGFGSESFPPEPPSEREDTKDIGAFSHAFDDLRLSAPKDDGFGISPGDTEIPVWEAGDKTKGDDAAFAPPPPETDPALPPAEPTVPLSQPPARPTAPYMPPVARPPAYGAPYTPWQPAPYASDPWRTPYNAYAPAPPDARYARPAPPVDPWHPRAAAPVPAGGTEELPRGKVKQKNGWKIGFICLLIAAVFFTGAVIYSASRAGLRLDFGPDGSFSLETRTPAGVTTAPTGEPASGAPNIGGNDPLDASGGTALEIVDQPVSTARPEAGQPLSIRQIAEKVLPSVVGILAGSENDYAMSSGSGVIMTPDGYVITNNHVVSGFNDISVVLSNGESYPVVQVRTDYLSDLAVLKIDADGLTAAEFGNSDQIAVGDLAVAIGNPLGMELQSTVTNGIISAINRDIVVDDLSMTMLQTNCAINPGNSGGPLLNEYGQVVGIISSKIMSDYYASAVEGLGFAIPSNTVTPIVNELIARGFVGGRPAIGITGQTVDARNARLMGVPQGFQVVSINEDCDAYRQGLRVDDIITAVFDKPVATVGEINAIKQEYQVGDDFTVTVYRPSERRSLEITFKLMDSGEAG